MVDFPNPQWCDAWGVPPLSDAFRVPVRSGRPVLLIAGTLDGLTPVRNAREVLRTLPNGVLITVTGGAHDNLADDPRVGRLVTEFLVGVPVHDTDITLAPVRSQRSDAAHQR
jgi:pimeloyl-ACP methyl ester carboxylesterase